MPAAAGDCSPESAAKSGIDLTDLLHFASLNAGYLLLE